MKYINNANTYLNPGNRRCCYSNNDCLLRMKKSQLWFQTLLDNPIYKWNACFQFDCKIMFVRCFPWYLHYRVSHQNPQRLHHNLLLVLPMTIGNFYPKVHKIRYPNNKSITQKKERAEANPLSSYFIQCLHIP